MEQEDYTQIIDEALKRVALNTKEILTIKEAAIYLGISTSKIYKLTSQNIIPYSKPMGKIIYFRRRDLEQWAMSNLIASEQQLDDQAMTFSSQMRYRA